MKKILEVPGNNKKYTEKVSGCRLSEGEMDYKQT